MSDRREFSRYIICIELSYGQPEGKTKGEKKKAKRGVEHRLQKGYGESFSESSGGILQPWSKKPYLISLSGTYNDQQRRIRSHLINAIFLVL